MSLLQVQLALLAAGFLAPGPLDDLQLAEAAVLGVDEAGLDGFGFHLAGGVR